MPSKVTTDALIAGLAAQAGELSNKAEELKRASRVTLFTRIAIFVSLLSTGIVAGVGTYYIVEVRHYQKGGRSVVDKIDDCTDPEGKCFKDAQKRTAELVVGLNAKTQQIVVAAAACAKVPSNVTEEQIRVCVEQKIK